MKRAKTSNKSIDQFQFHIEPISLTFKKKQVGNFYIYIEKGAQVLGKIQEQIAGRQVEHIFGSSNVKKFRIANEKALLMYQWTLYRLTEHDQEEYLESTSFNIKNRYQEYVKDLDRIQDDLYRIYAQKQKNTELQDIWKDLRFDLTKSQFQMPCTFNNLNANIKFKITIKCELDFMYQAWNSQKQRKKLQKQASVKRRSSMTSRNKTPQTSFIVSDKQKQPQANSKSSNNKRQPFSLKPVLDKQLFSSNNQQKLKQPQNENIRQSEIKITDPEGVDVTAQVPERYMNNKRANDDEYYTTKKTSMLSDIIEQSYEGSSNIHTTKANQAEKLKSLCQAYEQQQHSQMYNSPLVKTQTFESQKHDQMFSIKRTATFKQRSSQQFELQQNPKSSKKISKNQDYDMSHTYKTYNESYQDDGGMGVSEIKKKSSRKSSQIKQQQKQTIDIQTVRNNTFKNVIKIIIIVAILVVVVRLYNSYGRKDQIQDKYENFKGKKNKKQRKDKPDSKKQQISKSKSSSHPKKGLA